jgi:hypothetical protein
MSDHHEMLADSSSLLRQLQGFAACGDLEVRDAVPESLGRMRQMRDAAIAFDAMTIKAPLAFGMVVSNRGAQLVAELDEPWATGECTRVRLGLFDYISNQANR